MSETLAVQIGGAALALVGIGHLLSMRFARPKEWPPVVAEMDAHELELPGRTISLWMLHQGTGYAMGYALIGWGALNLLLAEAVVSSTAALYVDLAAATAVLYTAMHLLFPVPMVAAAVACLGFAYALFF